MAETKLEQWRVKSLLFCALFGVFTAIESLYKLHTAGQEVWGIILQNLFVAGFIALVMPVWGKGEAS